MARSVAAATALALAACAEQPVAVVSESANVAAEVEPLESWVVVGIAAGDADARRLEAELVRHLRPAAASVRPGHRLLGGGNERDTAAIRAAVEQVDAEAILLVRIVRVDLEGSVRQGRSEFKKTCRRGDPHDLFLYDYDEIAEPDTIELEHTVVLRSELYRAADGVLLWGMDSVCYRKATLDDALAAQAEAIAERLGERGWLRDE